MKYIKQLLLILAFTLAGEALQQVIPAPIPGAIYGLILMLIALCTGLLKPAHVEDTANYLIKIMPLLFIAPGVHILEHWDLISENLAAIAVIFLVSTWVVFAVAGLVTQAILKKKEGRTYD